MKKSAFVFIALATFVGVLGALRLNDWLGHRADTLTQSRTAAWLGEPVDYTGPVGGPADFRAAAKKVLPCIVSVDRYQEIESFFQEPSVQETASGSGVIISRDGTIITNNHVVEGASEVRIRLADKRTFKADVVGTDRAADLAVLRIHADGLNPIEMGDSDKVDVGEWVMAVGNPLGYDQTLSVGVVSSKGRSLPTQGGVLINAIQTDAAINPGNSGGALTDADGKLIGINSAISSNTGTSIGIGFAIPVNRMKRVAKDILETGHARNAYLGVFPTPRLDGLLADPDGRKELQDATETSGVPSNGVLVTERNLASGSPAERAGIRPLDVILSIDGKDTDDRVDFLIALDGKRPGDSITMRVWSKGKTKTLNVTLTEEPLQG